MSTMSEMKLYDAFDGQEISELSNFVKEKITLLEEIRKQNNNLDIIRALGDRIVCLKYLYEDMDYMWSEMMKDDCWNGIRRRHKFRVNK